MRGPRSYQPSFPPKNHAGPRRLCQVAPRAPTVPFATLVCNVYDVIAYLRLSREVGLLQRTVLGHIDSLIPDTQPSADTCETLR